MNYHTIHIPRLFNFETLNVLRSEQSRVMHDPRKIVIFTGDEEVFCHGLDFTWIMTQNFVIQSKLFVYFLEFLEFVKSTSFVSIALVQGEAVGGGVGVAAACDIVLAAEKASFQLTEGLFGLIPELILPTLATRSSIGAIKRIFFTAEKCSASRAKEVGLVDDIFKNNIDSSKIVSAWVKNIMRSHIDSIKDFKEILPKIYNIDKNNRDKSIDPYNTLLSKKLVDENIQKILKNYVHFGMAPWLEEV